MAFRGGPIAVTKQNGVALQRAKYSSKPAGKKCYEKPRSKQENTTKQDYYMISFKEEPGYWLAEILRSPGGPSTEGPADDGKRFYSDGRCGNHVLLC